MQVQFFINEFPALSGSNIVVIPNERMQSLPEIGDVIVPFNQDYSYSVMDVRRVQNTHTHTFLIDYIYHVHLKPENESAKIDFQRFKKKA